MLNTLTQGVVERLFRLLTPLAPVGAVHFFKDVIAQPKRGNRHLSAICETRGHFGANIVLEYAAH